MTTRGTLIGYKFELSNLGDGSLIRVAEGQHVYRSAYESMMTAKRVAEEWTGKHFKNDLIFVQTNNDYVSGGSGGAFFALHFISMLTKIPLRADTICSGAITESCQIIQVSSISEKMEAAKEAGYRFFIVAKEQPTEREIPGISIIRVNNIDDVWAVASECNCKACQWRRLKGIE